MDAAPAAIVVPAPSFKGLPHSWRQFNDAPDFLTRRGANAGAVATSWRYRPNSSGWAGSLPPDGIVVSVNLIRRNPGKTVGNLCGRTPHLRDYPLVRKLPLRLPLTTTHTFDGADDIPEYRIFGRIGDSYNFEVRVVIARHRPTPALLAAAQRGVSAIRFPRWPTPAHC
jgi:hypothetical protein